MNEGSDLALERLCNDLLRGVTVRFEDLAGGSHRRRDTGTAFGHRFENLNRQTVDIFDAVVETVRAQVEGRTTKGVGRDEVSAGFKIESSHVDQDLGPGQIHAFRAVSRRETACHELCSPGAVTTQNLARRQSFECRSHPTNSLTISTALPAS